MSNDALLALQLFLRQSLADPHERQRIAEEMGVSVMTLTRWKEGKAIPRLSNLEQLEKALPLPELHHLIEAYRQQLEQRRSGQQPDLAQEEYSGLLAPSLPAPVLPSIPSEIYEQVLKEYARPSSPTTAQAWSQGIVEYVLQHAVHHLDPQGKGMEIFLAQCMPPRADGIVQSLRETTSYSTLPGDQLPELYFLGAESLVGYALTQMRLILVADLVREQHIPHVHRENEASAAAIPILHHGRAAGCLLASSPHKHFFTQEQCKLISHYAHLIALAFPETSCYAPEQIRLRVMPSIEEQREKMQQAHILQRMKAKMLDAMRQHTYLSTDEAQLQVWQEIEEELLTLAASHE